MKFICITSFLIIFSGIAHAGFKTKIIQLSHKDSLVAIEVHFKESEREIAQRVIQIIKSDFKKIISYFDHIPQSTVHITFNDAANDANGFATVFPRNLIEINPFPPIGDEFLSSSRDWLKSVLIHEFIHVLHFDYTSGILKFLRIFLGSTAKMGGVVPRWFAEGVAVWGESFFTEEGRLKNETLKYQLAMKISDNNYCNSLDCLDGPREYPFEGFPYWAGGFFLEYLEKIKTGGIKCLVKDNSYKIPFFLNSAFYACYSKSAEDLFDDFRKDFIRNYKWSYVRNSRRYIAWEKGYFISNDYFIYVKYVEKKEVLVVEDFDGNIKKEFKLSNSIEGISKDLVNKKNVLLRTSDYRGGSFSRGQLLLDLDKLTIEKKYEDFDAQYALEFQGKLYYFRFFENRWSLYKGNNSVEMTRFPINFNIYSPRIYKNIVIFISDYDGGFGLYHLNLDKNLLYQLASLDENITDLDFCNENLLFKSKNNIYRLMNFTKPSKVTLDFAKVEDDLLDLRFSSNKIYKRSTKSPKPFIEEKGDCRDWLQNYRFKSKTKSLIVQEIKFSSVGSNQEKELLYDLDLEYPRFIHFLPTHMLFYYMMTGNLTTLSAATSLQDPLEINKISLVFDYYQSLSKFGGDIDYSYSWRNNSISLNSQTSYSYSSYSDSENESQNYIISYLRNAQLGHYHWSGSLSAYFFNEKDFISNRKGKRYSLTQTLSFLNQDVEAFFKNWSLSVSVLMQETEKYDDFNGLRTKYKNRFRLTPNWSSNLNVAYSKYFKDTIQDGTLYGGDVTDFFRGNIFNEFYGLNYSDLFGNEILTGRINFENILFKDYKGIKSFPFFPLFRKEWKFTYGAEYAKGHYIYADKKLWKNNDIISSHVGLSLDTQLAYLVPSRFDLIATYNLNKGNEKRILFLFTPSLNF